MEKGRKFILANSIVFLALHQKQIVDFLNRYGYNQEIEIIPATDEDYIDFNLLRMKSNGFVLKENIPFSRQAKIKLNCPYLAYWPSDLADGRKKKFHLCRHYFCCNHWVKLQAAQLEPEYALLEGCCGIFDKKFYEKLNEGLR